MTRRTKTSLIRKYEVVNERGDIERRKKEIPPMPTFKKPCDYCKKPMVMTVGQVARFHGQCKKEGKRAIRKRKLIYSV